MDHRDHYEVVVVGGGVSGCAAARELAPDHDVLLLEKGQIAGEASGLAAGNCAPTLFYDDEPEIARFANQYFREVDGTGQFEYHERPRVELLRAREADAGRERVARLADEGFPVTFLDAGEAADRYPAFDLSSFAGVVEYDDTGWLDPYTYTVTLRESAADRGTDVQTNCPVEGLVVRGGEVHGVETADGTVTADAVVVAVGWRIRELLAEFVSLPVRPFKLQCAILRGETDLLRSFPTGRVPSEELYFRGELNGDLLVGGDEYFVEGSEATAMASGAGVDESFRTEVALTVPEFMAGFGRAELVDAWAGVDAATPDARPIIDAPPEGPDGLVVSTGYNGLGMLNSGVAAGAVRALVAGEEPPFPLEPFALERFPDGEVSFGLAGTFGAGGVT